MQLVERRRLVFYARVSAQRKGYVALLKDSLTPKILGEIIDIWLLRFDRVEQLKTRDKALAAFVIRAPEEVVWEKDPQFRVMAGEQFTWVYFTADRRIVESDGLAEPGGPFLSKDVFVEIPEYLEKVVDDTNDRALDQWEKEGLM